jgi:collagenase-like PrtC family protease
VSNYPAGYREPESLDHFLQRQADDLLDDVRVELAVLFHEKMIVSYSDVHFLIERMKHEHDTRGT